MSHKGRLPAAGIFFSGASMKVNRLSLAIVVCLLTASTLLFAGSSDWAPSLHSKAFVVEKLSNGWRLISPGKPHSITRSDTARHPGGQSIRFELRDGEAWNAPVEPSFRSEISTDEYVALGKGRTGFIPRLP
jgi:hypothetical protein